jgi:two-component system, NarL family, captular synthesis response regulator RcsB
MNFTDKIKATLADPRLPVLRELHDWFASHERYCVVGCAQDAPALLDSLTRDRGDLVVAGSELLGADFDVLRELRRRHPDLPVVVYTSIADGRALRAMQLAGATGLIGANDGMRDFERVCSRVMSGATSVMSKRIAASCEAAPVEVVETAQAPGETHTEPQVETRSVPAPSFGLAGAYGSVQITVKPILPKSG